MDSSYSHSPPLHVWEGNDSDFSCHSTRRQTGRSRHIYLYVAKLCLSVRVRNRSPKNGLHLSQLSSNEMALSMITPLGDNQGII